MEDFNSKYSGEQVESYLDQIASGNTGGGGIVAETDPIFSASPAASITNEKMAEWDSKQEAISDIETIRSGASKGATALQSVPDGYATTSELEGKVDKVDGKQLSTEDFTSILKAKLEGLNNYDDAEIRQAIAKLRTDLDTLVSGDTTTAIKTFNEVIAFLDGLEDTEDLASIIAAIEQQIAAKYTKPSDGIPKTDLAPSVRTSLGKADTALQNYTEQYKGTVTKVKINGSEKTPDSNGVVDLGTITGEGGGSSSGGSGAYSEVNHGTADTTFTLTPNTFHVWDEVASLTLSFGDEIAGIANEFLFQFTSGATATSLSLPSVVEWVGGIPTIEPNKVYQCSIINNIGLIVGV